MSRDYMGKAEFQDEAKEALKDLFKCPRRAESPIGVSPIAPTNDEWRRDGKMRTCSWCGSLHPDDFMHAVEIGAELTPTDKNYKVYLMSSRAKFYFQHLGDEQKTRFVELLNTKKARLSEPFYVLPFFITKR